MCQQEGILNVLASRQRKSNFG